VSELLKYPTLNVKINGTQATDF